MLTAGSKQRVLVAAQQIVRTATSRVPRTDDESLEVAFLCTFPITFLKNRNPLFKTERLLFFTFKMGSNLPCACYSPQISLMNMWAWSFH